MSWSVAALGKAKDVIPEIASQIAKISVSDAGEACTVENVGILLIQALAVYDEQKLVKVSASGHVGYGDWETKTGGFQNVSISIEPIHVTV